MLRSTFDKNTAVTGSGGAIDDAAGGINVTDSYFTNNSSKADGGGFNSRGGDIKVLRSVISGNIATNGEGGGFTTGPDGVTTVTTVSYSTISGNTAGGNGGGFAAYGLTLTMDHSTVSGNRSGSDGGGVFIATTGNSPRRRYMPRLRVAKRHHSAAMAPSTAAAASPSRARPIRHRQLDHCLQYRTRGGGLFDNATWRSFTRQYNSCVE